MLDFLRIRTFVHIEDPVAAAPLLMDAELLAQLEGLEGHARSAAYRRSGGASC